MRERYAQGAAMVFGDDDDLAHTVVFRREAGHRQRLADLERRGGASLDAAGREREAQFPLEVVVPANGALVGCLRVDDDLLLDARFAP